MKMRNILWLALVLINVLIPAAELTSKFTLDIEYYDVYRRLGIYSKDYPRYYAKIKAHDNGTNIELSKENIVILEDILTSPALSLSAPDTEGWQTLEWITRSRGPIVYGNEVIIYATYGKEVDTTGAWYRNQSMAIVEIRNNGGFEEEDLFFGEISPGMSSERRLIVYAASSLFDDNGVELPIMVDSIRTYTEEFTEDWKGSLTGPQKPPVAIEPGIDYKVYVDFTPQDTSYKRDKLKIFYEGGRVEQIHMVGNKYIMPNETLLKVIYPNGGETFAPCDVVTIKWEGHVKEIPTKIELSLDGGNSWQILEEYWFDSTYNWTVPDLQTEQAYIRVKQELQSNYPRVLKVDNVPVRKIAYKWDGYKILSADDIGRVYEWDLKTYANSEPYRYTYVNYPQDRSVPLGLEYLTENRFAIYFHNIYGMTGYRVDSLAIFELGNSEAIIRKEISPGFVTKGMLTDAKKRFITLVPEMGNTIELYSAEDGSFIRSVVFDDAITSFTYSSTKDTAAAALITGEVKLLSLPDFQEVGSYDLSDLPIIIELGLSPNGKYLALGCKAPMATTVGSNKNENHVFDLTTNKLIRTVRNTASDPVGLEFNPTSTVLIVGSVAQPQIAFWDLPHNDYEGSLSGNAGTLTDFKFSPEGHSIATASASSDNLTVRFFTYPEQDSSDHAFRVFRPVLSIDTIEIEPKYLATENKYNFNTNVCNIGTVPIIFYDIWMAKDRNFHLDGIQKPDTLYPGDCLDIPIIYVPVDTGKITDSVVFISCGGRKHYLPLHSSGLPRNISFHQEVFDFGQVCIGKEKQMQVIFAKNEDPVPLIINSIEVQNNNGFFTVLDPSQEVLLDPGESTEIRMAFHPWSVEIIERPIAVYHSNQRWMYPKAVLRGEGIGTLIKTDKSDLRFIPELLTRELNITNESAKDILIETIEISPANSGYRVLTQLPIPIAAGASAKIEISWDGLSETEANLFVEATPCASSENITLGRYRANFRVFFDDTEADPRRETSLSLNYEGSENRPYNGKRFFEAEFDINARIFFPTKIKSDFGDAEIIKNVVTPDRRRIVIRVEGDFSTSGKLAEIKGVPGLAETDTSTIRIYETSLFFGLAAKITTGAGLFTLINNEGRRIERTEPGLVILSVQPNPASSSVMLQVKSKEAGTAKLEIYDNVGNIIISLSDLNITSGINSISADVSTLNNGAYRAVVKTGTDAVSETIVILR